MIIIGSYLYNIHFVSSKNCTFFTWKNGMSTIKVCLSCFDKRQEVLYMCLMWEVLPWGVLDICPRVSEKYKHSIHVWQGHILNFEVSLLSTILLLSLTSIFFAGLRMFIIVSKHVSLKLCSMHFWIQNEQWLNIMVPSKG